MSQPEIAETILSIFSTRGGENYANEAVTQLQHAVQCALLAKQDAADSSLIVAALLHDIGHLLHEGELPTDLSDNLDDFHEQKGYAFLKRHFGTLVADPVRLHVAAKRYLCTVEPDYLSRLSPTSLKSFLDQGGLMNLDEVKAFRLEPHYESAVRLRRWDDAAKDPSAVSIAVEEFLAEIADAWMAANRAPKNAQSG
jgi:phosphonate degradation associated HDIG domain protein